MRTAAAATALGLTLLVAAGLAACSPDDPVTPPDPVPSSTPVFASDEEALAAAEDAYAAYLDATNETAQLGWSKIESLSAVARDTALQEELSSAGELHADGYRQVGEATFDSTTLQQVSDDGVAVSIRVYLCLDVSGVDVVDAAGKSVVSEDRPDRQPLEVEVDNVDASFKVSRSEAWSGANFC